MKRGDYAALLSFALLAGFAFYHARGLETVVPPLGDLYFQVPIWPLQDALSSTRTLGYPLLHAFIASQGHGLPAYPEAQMLILIPCVLVFVIGLRAYGLSGIAALVAASPLLWIVPVEQVIPETVSKCFAIASAGFLLWAAGTRSRMAMLGLAVSVFAACQMRPAFLFLVVWVPLAWIFLYLRRWGWHHQAHLLRNGLRVGLACTVPLFLFCLLRLILVGHFGLVSFGGQNTIGISIEMLDSKTVGQLPVSDRPLAQILARGRDAWPEARFITSRGLIEDWTRIAPLYAANVNRIGRTLEAKFPQESGKSDNVTRDKALSRLSIHTFLIAWPRYLEWLTGAATESLRMALHLLLGGGGDEGFGLGPVNSLAVTLGLIALLLLSWPLERRAFGEGSRPYFTRGISVLIFIAGTFFLASMLVVILVEPPIARYVEAAAFMLPCVAAALAWDRSVVLAAALCHRPHWYNLCYAAYPAIPDVRHAFPWLHWGKTMVGNRRRFGAACTVLFLVVGSILWTTRDNRLFHIVASDPGRVRAHLLASNPPVDWRADDGATLLHYAALHGDTELVNHILSQEGADINATTRDGANALHWAAMGARGDAVIPLLLARGLSPEVPGPLGLSPLHLAALFSNDASLEGLLAHDARADVPSPTGITPLHLAGSPAAAEVLLSHGARVDAADSTGATPLMWTRDRALSRTLLEHGANINAQENWRSFVRGCTPLLRAAYQSDNEQAFWLLEQGADPNRGDINQMGPIFYAIWRKNAPLLQTLLDHKVSLETPGRWVEYNRATTSSRYTDIFSKTVGRHASHDSFPRLVHDEATLYPLDWAAFLGNVPAMETLIDRGARLDLHNEYGMSALHWAILGRQDRTEKLLRLLDPDLARLDDAQLPLGPFREAVAAGHRALGPVLPPKVTLQASLPATSAAVTEPPAIGAPARATVPIGPEALHAAARREAQALDKGAPDVLVAEDGFLFTRKSCNYLLETDFLHAIPGDSTSGPSPAFTAILDLHRQLDARGIRLVVVPAPIAIEVHTDAFVPGWDPRIPSVPARGAFIRGLCEAGVDALDVLPRFIAERLEKPDQALYLKEDGHWNSTAMGIATEFLSEHLRELPIMLPWGSQAYTTTEIELQPGATVLIERLTEDLKPAYLSARWSVIQVHYADGVPYRSDETGPVLVAGDSYTLMFQEVSGQFSARLAAQLGLPVAMLGGKAAGPSSPRLLARRGKDYIDAHKVIVWVFSAAYIRPTGQEQWEPLVLP